MKKTVGRYLFVSQIEANQRTKTAISREINMHEAKRRFYTVAAGDSTYRSYGI